jgi:hypothetical protein
MTIRVQIRCELRKCSSPFKSLGENGEWISTLRGAVPVLARTLNSNRVLIRLVRREYCFDPSRLSSRRWQIAWRRQKRAQARHRRERKLGLEQRTLLFAEGQAITFQGTRFGPLPLTQSGELENYAIRRQADRSRCGG